MERIRSYIGSIGFYKYVSLIAIPLGLQQLITSCMGIIDSLMVSWIGQVTAVGTAVQIETLCTAVSWACAAGVGIFSVQFFGAKDILNLKKSFGLSMILAVISGGVWLVLAALFGRQILCFYIQDISVINNGLLYLRIAMFSYVFLALEFAFNIIYRNINKPRIPLIIGLMTMIINIVCNYILIFGMYGFPKLGIQGAALGTCMAHMSGVICHFLYAYRTKQPFIGSFQEMFSLDYRFIKPIMRKTRPIIINELFFGFGSTLFIKAFGTLGTASMDAYYVGAKISDIFYAFANGFSNAVAAVIGITLGSGDIEKAKREGNYFIGMAICLSIAVMGLIFICSEFFVSIFHLNSFEVIKEAILIVKVFALRIALRFFIVIVFSSLRAGGDSKMLTLLDSGLMWGIGIPLAFISVHFLHLQSIAFVFLICQLEQIIRVYFGLKRYQKGEWAVNLTTLITK
ncbi:MATE family efflux transporter [Candidatus Stoquefichus massiliensis]|uniref:MATE family efflux transporter n=1 Tax=Candidatus Stoquefichus massiliensis TaxID=1470350 RepID=UPI0004828AB9|nr:MATE family efflux transporter [Candidatus Stoquefichus massiliensis]